MAKGIGEFGEVSSGLLEARGGGCSVSEGCTECVPSHTPTCMRWSFVGRDFACFVPSFRCTYKSLSGTAPPVHVWEGKGLVPPIFVSCGGENMEGETRR